MFVSLKIHTLNTDNGHFSATRMTRFRTVYKFNLGLRTLVILYTVYVLIVPPEMEVAGSQHFFLIPIT